MWVITDVEQDSLAQIQVESGISWDLHNQSFARHSSSDIGKTEDKRVIVVAEQIYSCIDSLEKTGPLFCFKLPLQLCKTKSY